MIKTQRKKTAKQANSSKTAHATLK